ncbi:MAG: hypothetical protein KUF72_03695 [Candidatus Thiodiazotropha sp. (ex Ctena orbiculata)]|nr:hypothetical protein [Candidatus Thiodiazotropha taylori]
MPVKKSGKKKKELEHSFLTIPVDAYQASTSADPNSNVLGTPRYVDGEEPAIVFHTRLELSGTCTDPPTRAGEPYTIMLYGEAFPTGDLALKIKDLHQHDKAGHPIYRHYRGRQYPRYDEPPSLGLVEKAWGERRWIIWAHLATPFFHNALILLNGNKRLYVAVHERKVGRTRWVRALSLQTNDPAEA